MNSSRWNRAVSAFLVVFVIVGLTAANAKAGIEEPPSSYEAVSRKGQPIILHYDPNPPTTLRVPPPRVFSELSIQSSTIQINYLAAGETALGSTCYQWSNEAKAAFNYAASIWESLLNSTVPIEIDACWTELSGTILGGSSANYVRNTSTSTWYQESLANSLAGFNIDADDPDMTIVYNRNFDWYYGTDGNTPSGKMDLVSVVLHEICHGLGFGGSMTVEGSTGYWGWNYYPDPAIYDRFAENGSGTPLLDLGNGTSALGSALTGGDIYFNGTNANAANGGSRPELYAPGDWASGSSYSHLDYDTFNETDNELMVWAISDGESIHNPGPITMGMFEDLGWTTSETAPPPTVTSITPNSASNDGIVHITELAGSDFVGSTVKLTKAGEEDISGTSVTVNSNTITCDFDLTGATAGTWNVVVTNEDEQFDTLVGGFTVIAAPAPDVSISKNVIGSDFSPGDHITFTLDIANTGTLSATNVVVTDDLPTEVLSPTYASTIITPPTGTLSYPHVWDIGALESGESGVITIYGQIDPDLSSSFSFVNSAVISDPEDNTSSNNSDSVLIGEHKIYLPLVTKVYPPIPATPVLNAISNSDGDGDYTVSWNTAARADTYTLEEDDNSGFSNPTTVYGPGSATSTGISGKSNGTYYYRVKATNSWGDSGWSNVRSVKVSPPTKFYPVADATVIQNYPTNNFGSTTDMWVGYDHCIDGKKSRSLVRFDLSDVPAGVSISNATLYLYHVNSCYAKANSHTVTVYRAKNSWSSSSVTWNSQPGYGESYGSASVPASTFGRHSFNMTELVRKWVNGSYANYGIVLRGPEGSGDSGARLGFGTVNASGTTYDPYLIITYAGMTTSEEVMPAVEEMPEAIGCGPTVEDVVGIFPTPLDSSGFGFSEQEVCFSD